MKNNFFWKVLQGHNIKRIVSTGVELFVENGDCIYFTKIKKIIIIAIKYMHK